MEMKSCSFWPNFKLFPLKSTYQPPINNWIRIKVCNGGWLESDLHQCIEWSVTQPHPSACFDEFHLWEGCFTWDRCWWKAEQQINQCQDVGAWSKLSVHSWPLQAINLLSISVETKNLFKKQFILNLMTTEAGTNIGKIHIHWNPHTTHMYLHLFIDIPLTEKGGEIYMEPHFWQVFSSYSNWKTKCGGRWFLIRDQSWLHFVC